ncbi:hypothetical protein GGC63_000684 [Paenibacillus sp. OAS669]|nr:hypothetical protein [Paenibacillus sp. OAS669]
MIPVKGASVLNSLAPLRGAIFYGSLGGGAVYSASRLSQQGKDGMNAIVNERLVGTGFEQDGQSD